MSSRLFLPPVGESALDLMRRRLSLKPIPTLCAELDAMCGGGIPVGQITEFCGIPGCQCRAIRRGGARDGSGRQWQRQRSLICAITSDSSGIRHCFLAHHLSFPLFLFPSASQAARRSCACSWRATFRFPSASVARGKGRQSTSVGLGGGVDSRECVDAHAGAQREVHLSPSLTPDLFSFPSPAVFCCFFFVFAFRHGGLLHA